MKKLALISLLMFSLGSNALQINPAAQNGIPAGIAGDSSSAYSAYGSTPSGSSSSSPSSSAPFSGSSASYMLSQAFAAGSVDPVFGPVSSLVNNINDFFAHMFQPVPPVATIPVAKKEVIIKTDYSDLTLPQFR